MDTLQCAVVLAKMERLDWEIERRLALGARYDALLAPHVRITRIKPDRTSVHGQYTIRSAERDRLQEHLKRRGIPTAVHYPLSLHQQPAYRGDYVGLSYPRSEKLAREVLSLPMSADLAESSQQLIIDSIKDALRVAA
jgi:UDP-2-acetamido-2-deoxy-ribo-hexuluronate aminotransferase